MSGYNVALQLERMYSASLLPVVGGSAPVAVANRRNENVDAKKRMDNRRKW